MAYETRIVRNRKSPGGRIECDSEDCDGMISRRKYNNYTRFGQKPKCPMCGGTTFTATAPHVIRGGRLIWTPRKKFIRKFVQGKRS